VRGYDKRERPTARCNSSSNWRADLLMFEAKREYYSAADNDRRQTVAGA
jgi:hypothetical protein